MCLSGKTSAVVVTQAGAPSSGNQMPEMNEIGRNVSWANGIACSLDRASEPAARPSDARQAAPSAAVRMAAGSDASGTSTPNAGTATRNNTSSEPSPVSIAPALHEPR
jgi:hypothetical protein